MSPKKTTQKGFTAEEKAAMKERARELKAEARVEKDRAAGEADVLAKIAEMPKSDRAMAKRLHKIVKDNAPDLWPRTWYGMPAYARDGKVVCFFQSADKTDGEGEVLAKIADMAAPDRTMAQRIHALVKASAPTLSPKTWYGMPAYARDGKIVCYFTSAQKFKTRYATFGFSDEANLDEGAMWPVAFALKKPTGADEARIGALVKKAVS